jgi:hypothetical protein
MSWWNKFLFLFLFLIWQVIGTQNLKDRIRIRAIWKVVPTRTMTQINIVQIRITAWTNFLEFF